MIFDRQGLRAVSWLLAAGLAGSLIWGSRPLLAQEIPIEQTDLSAEEAEALLEGLPPDEVRELCRRNPSLRSTAPCREALKGAGGKGGGSSEAPATSPVEIPAATSVLGTPSPAATPAGASAVRARGQASRPRISVDKRNDADGDGTYTSDEVAPRPGADVPFRVRITNVGRRTVRIKRIVDSYRQTRTQVCDELGGQRIRPAASIACTFVLEDYAPPRFDSVANIVDVRVTDQSSGRRASGSDLSTVTTLNNGGDRVLGATTTSPNTEGAGTTASTGFDLMPVSALAALLLASGAGLVRLGEGPVRARRKHREKEKRAGRIPARSAGF